MLHFFNLWNCFLIHFNFFLLCKFHYKKKNYIHNFYKMILEWNRKKLNLAIVLLHVYKKVSLKSYFSVTKSSLSLHILSFRQIQRKGITKINMKKFHCLYCVNNLILLWNWTKNYICILRPLSKRHLLSWFMYEFLHSVV